MALFAITLQQLLVVVSLAVFKLVVVTDVVATIYLMFDDYVDVLDVDYY